jgi:hypothetical protein
MDKGELIEQAKKMEQESTYSAVAHFIMYKIWNNFRFFIGIPAIILNVVWLILMIPNFNLDIYILGITELLLVAFLVFYDIDLKKDRYSKTWKRYYSIKLKIHNLTQHSKGEIDKEMFQKIRFEFEELNNNAPKVWKYVDKISKTSKIDTSKGKTTGKNK